MVTIKDIEIRLRNGQTLIDDLIKKERDLETLYQETMGVSFEIDEDKIAQKFYDKILEDLQKFAKERGIY
jgi:Mn-dependent DtxR family transcriptional regulator